MSYPVEADEFQNLRIFGRGERAGELLAEVPIAVVLELLNANPTLALFLRHLKTRR